MRKLSRSHFVEAVFSVEVGLQRGGLLELVFPVEDVFALLDPDLPRVVVVGERSDEFFALRKKRIQRHELRIFFLLFALELFAMDNFGEVAVGNGVEGNGGIALNEVFGQDFLPSNNLGLFFECGSARLGFGLLEVFEAIGKAPERTGFGLHLLHVTVDEFLLLVEKPVVLLQEELPFGVFVVKVFGLTRTGGVEVDFVGDDLGVLVGEIELVDGGSGGLEAGAFKDEGHC